MRQMKKKIARTILSTVWQEISMRARMTCLRKKMSKRERCVRSFLVFFL